MSLAIRCANMDSPIETNADPTSASPPRKGLTMTPSMSSLVSGTISLPLAGTLLDRLRLRNCLGRSCLSYPSSLDGQNERNGQGMMQGGSRCAGNDGIGTKPSCKGGGGRL